MSHSPDGRIQGVWKKFNSKNEMQEIHSGRCPGHKWSRIAENLDAWLLQISSKPAWMHSRRYSILSQRWKGKYLNISYPKTAKKIANIYYNSMACQTRKLVQAPITIVLNSWRSGNLKKNLWSHNLPKNERRISALEVYYFKVSTKESLWSCKKRALACIGN